MYAHDQRSYPAGALPCARTLRVALIAKPGHAATGVGRYVEMLHTRLAAGGVDVVRVAPALPPLPAAAYDGLLRFGADLRAFLRTYPVWARYPPADVYHLTSQNLAALLILRRPPGRVVVTVHDILPHLLRRDPALSPLRRPADQLFDRMAMAGLRRADRLVADSDYTRRCVVEHLGIPASRVAVSHLGIDHSHFRPGAGDPAALRERYALDAGRRYLIYVGSEDPRKNLAALLRALAAARATLPDLCLLKVGRAHFVEERRRLVALADELGLRGAVTFLDDVPEADLPDLYGLAAACVQPSLYEGFGFPLLEAMACGVPSIYARASSLPELAGDAALAFDPWAPGAADELAALICRLIADPALQLRLRAEGLRRAAAFTWERTVAVTFAAYRGDGLSTAP